MATKQDRMAAKFGPGTRVVGTDGPAIGDAMKRYGTVEGTVRRFVPGNNAQGGYVVVDWDGGTTGRTSPGSLATVSEAGA